MKHSKPATNTDQPANFYNKHISAPLVLQCVKRLPSLVQDLATNVDRTLRAASETLPPVEHFATTAWRNDDMRNAPLSVGDEIGVVNFYSRITARFCTPLASTLALHPKALNSDWKSLLMWTQADSFSGSGIIRGELQIMGAANDAHELAILETVDSETRQILEEMKDFGSPFGTWEMISPFTGSREVMSTVPNLGEFSWKFCRELRGSNNLGHETASQNVKEVMVRRDTLAPPWKITVSSILESDSMRLIVL